jgi:hypothetical protein
VLEKPKIIMNGRRFNLNCILWTDTEKFNVILELLLGKIKKEDISNARETTTNEGFVICHTPEDTIAILEPVIVGQ